MKKLMLLAVTVCALAGAGIASGVATADNNGATTTHFSVAYFGQFTCTGERIVKTGPKEFVKDSETCLDSAIGDIAPGTYDLGPNGWYSDYEAFFLNSGLRFDTSATLVVTLNDDGTTTWNIVAYYAP